MENIDKNIKKEKSNDPFDDYFENLDIDSDIRKLYELIGDDEQKDEFERNSYLNKLRNKNHKRYYDINISKLENLPYDFDDIIKDIIKLYGFIDYKNLLTQNLEDSQNSEKLLNNIYKKLNRLEW